MANAEDFAPNTETEDFEVTSLGTRTVADGDAPVSGGSSSGTGYAFAPLTLKRAHTINRTTYSIGTAVTDMVGVDFDELVFMINNNIV